MDKELKSVLQHAPRRTVDVLAKARTRRPAEVGGRERLILVHVEVDAGRSRRLLARRMHRYFHRILDWFDLPVLPIALYLRLRGDGLGWESYELAFWNHRFVRFEFPYVALPGIAGEPYLQTDNPIGWALTGLMQIDPARRARVKAEALRRVQEWQLDRTHRGVLVECLEAYSPLDDSQQREFDELFQGEEYQEARTMVQSTLDHMMQTTFEKGIEKGIERGIEQGQQRLLATMIDERFGPLSSRMRSRIERLSAAESQRIAVKLLTAKSLKELGL